MKKLVLVVLLMGVTLFVGCGGGSSNSGGGGGNTTPTLNGITVTPAAPSIRAMSTPSALRAGLRPTWNAPARARPRCANGTARTSASPESRRPWKIENAWPLPNRSNPAVFASAAEICWKPPTGCPPSRRSQALIHPASPPAWAEEPRQSPPLPAISAAPPLLPSSPSFPSRSRLQTPPSRPTVHSNSRPLAITVTAARRTSLRPLLGPPVPEPRLPPLVWRPERLPARLRLSRQR